MLFNRSEKYIFVKRSLFLCDTNFVIISWFDSIVEIFKKTKPSPKCKRKVS